MPDPIHKFDPINCPLIGSNLLEASAGTGKTYSLSFLYLRLLLEQNLSVEKILVTTFTKAAVAELKERIYARLNEAEIALTYPENKNEVDPILSEYLIRFSTSPEKKSETIKRLQLARAQFNLAQIRTIDGLALQLLNDNYLSLASYEVRETLNDHRDIIQRIYLDLARKGFADCPDFIPEMAELLNANSTEKNVQLLLEVSENLTGFERAETDIWQSTLAIEAQARQLFEYNITEISDELTHAITTKQLDGRSYRLTTLESNINVLAAKEVDLLFSQSEAFERFFSSKQLIEKSKGFTPHHPFYHQFGLVMAEKPNYAPLKQRLFHQTMVVLARYINQQCPTYLAEQSARSHRDVIKLVATAASTDMLHCELQAALIDEAQDTDQSQLAIFTHLFVNKNKICFFVGDPKQAIYGFRGADIFAYLAIQQSVEQRYLLETNYRSSQALNDSINAIFTKENIFIQDGISYQPVCSQQKNHAMSQGEFALEVIKLASYQPDSIALSCAQHIVQLLQSGQRINDKPLQHQDIAILVRSAGQAEKIKSALAQVGLSAAYTGKQNVFQSDEAQYFYWLLNALLHPNYRHIKALLISPLYPDQLININNEDRLSEVTQRMVEYHDSFNRKGFSSTFYQLLLNEKICGNLLKQSDGKRRLTNFLHIFELLQVELQNSQLSLAGLCYLLEQKIANNTVEAELRLDDEKAITIQTIHKSKGLEYPIVFNPYLDYDASKTKTSQTVIHSNALKLACFYGDQSQRIITAVKNEEQAENRRLAYVALTRAKYKNFIFLSHQETDFGRSKPSANSLWQQLIQPNASECYQSLLTSGFTREINLDTLELDLSTEASTELIPRLAQKIHRTRWQLDSFSAIANLSHHDEPNLQQSEATADNSALLHFPKGPDAGTALHEMFEEYMLTRQEFTPYIKVALQKHLANETVSPSFITQLNQELGNISQILLAPYSFSLNDIEVRNQSIEMEFFLHLEPNERQNLFTLFKQTPYHFAEGYLHGFIDLMFYHEGQYYILDYKSNYLGSRYADYNMHNMKLSMQSHDYTMQALIYTVALCKHLQNTLTDFDYHRDVGGAFYLFLRGMQKDKTTGIHFHKPDWETVNKLLTVNNKANTDNDSSSYE